MATEAEKGIISHVLAEVRKGTELSKIAIPTHFIGEIVIELHPQWHHRYDFDHLTCAEPRSILEKFSDVLGTLSSVCVVVWLLAA